jgi:hypothetical protein
MHRSIIRLGAGLAAAVLVLLMLAACASAPKANLTLDLAGIETPVMLTPVQDPAKTLAVTLESGYSSQSVTATTSYGGRSASATIIVNRDIQRPLRDQLMPTLLQSPDWLAVDFLALVVKSVLGMSWSSDEYLLRLGLRAPLGR